MICLSTLPPHQHLQSMSEDFLSLPLISCTACVFLTTNFIHCVCISDQSIFVVYCNDDKTEWDVRLEIKRCGFDARFSHCPVVTLDKLFTHVPVCLLFDHFKWHSMPVFISASKNPDPLKEW